MDDKRIDDCLKTCNHVTLCINGSLYVVAYAEALVGFHQPGIGQRNLALSALLKLVAIALVTLLVLLA